MVTMPRDYVQLCLVEPRSYEEFPVLSPASVNVDKTSNTTMTTRKGDGESNTTSSAVVNDTIRLYRCVCPHVDVQDVRTTRSYCPLDHVCGIPPALDATVDCVTFGDPWMTVTRFAWPVLFISVTCLLVALTLTRYGMALHKFLAKAYWGLKLRLMLVRGVDGGNNNANNSDTPGDASTSSEEMPLSPIERMERAEVDALMEFAATSSTSWTGTNHHRPPPAPSRWQVRRHKEYLYHNTILDRARILWRHELRRERRERATQPPPSLLLPVKLYYLEKLKHATGENNTGDEDPAFTCSICFTCGEDSPPICSICFVEVIQGDKIGDLYCGHVFHSICLKTWLATGRSNRCPLCQAPKIATPQWNNGSSGPEDEKPMIRRGESQSSSGSSTRCCSQATNSDMTAINMTSSTRTDETSSST